MSYVNIKVTREGVTAEQKAALIKGLTQLLVDVLNKNPKTCACDPTVRMTPAVRR